MVDYKPVGDENIQTDASSMLVDRLNDIYADENRDLLSLVQGLVTPEADELAKKFYENLLQIKESHPYLDHKVVNTRLRRSMTMWLQDLFLSKDLRSVPEQIKRQQVIGDVHARIHVPMRLVNHGFRFLKGEIAKLIKASSHSIEMKLESVLLISNLLDFAASFINERYVVNRMSNERDTQALRMHIMSVSLVIEMERLRASLFDWMRKNVTEIYSNFPENKPKLASVYTTDLGLWVAYKADMLFEGRPQLLERLRNQLDQIDQNIEKINQLSGEDLKSEIHLAIDYLNSAISKTAWLIGDFSSQAYEMESGRDPLTRLFNRRFLPPVMQNMIRVANSTSTTFAVITCDIDDFKLVNDRYGHDAGDKLLIQFGEFLATNVRATDYVFRMGGDEFLIVLPTVNIDSIHMLAKKLLSQLSEQAFAIRDDLSVSLASSLGIVMYDGHPDYKRLLTQADEALYKVKQKGKGDYYFDANTGK